MMKNSAVVLCLLSLVRVSNTWAFPPETAQFGTGYDTLSNQELGQQCVVYDGRDDETNVRELGQRANYTMSHITSMQSLKRELGVEANASFGFGVFSGNCKVDYLNSEEFNEYSSFMVIKLRVENQTESLRRFVLSDWARDILAQQGAPAFFQACGDTFVAGQKTGGEIIAIVSFTTTSQDKKEELRTEIQTSAPAFSADGSLTTSLRQIAQSTQHSVKIFREGACGTLPTLDALQDTIRRFPNEVDRTQGGRPWVLDAVVRPYRVVQNLPVFAGGLIALNAQHHLLNDLATTRENALLLRNNIRRVLNDPAKFENPDINSLNQNLSEVNLLIDNLGRRAELCTQDPQQNCNFAATEHVLPRVSLPRSVDRTTEPPNLVDPIIALRARLRAQANSEVAALGQRSPVYAIASIVPEVNAQLSDQIYCRICREHGVEP